MTDATYGLDVPVMRDRSGGRRLSIGTHGTIRAKKLGDSRWTARARVRDVDGRVRDISRIGATKAEAIAALRAAVADRPGFNEERQLAARKRVTTLLAPSVPDERPHVLYRFFDADGTLLYVGISVATLRRMGQHRRSAQWFLQVARCEFQHFPDRASALEAEHVAIRDEKPLFNIAA